VKGGEKEKGGGGGKKKKKKPSTSRSPPGSRRVSKREGRGGRGGGGRLIILSSTRKFREEGGGELECLDLPFKGTGRERGRKEFREKKGKGGGKRKITFDFFHLLSLEHRLPAAKGEEGEGVQKKEKERRTWVRLLLLS